MLNWIQIISDDAEYNEHHHVKNGLTFVIHSDRDGEVWNLIYPDDSSNKLDAKNKFEAKAEALTLIKEYEET